MHADHGQAVHPTQYKRKNQKGKEPFAAHLLCQVQCDRSRRNNSADSIQRRTEMDPQHIVDRPLQTIDGQVQRVAHTSRSHNCYFGAQRYDHAKHKQEQQLVGSVSKVSQDQGTDGFLSFHTV